VIQIPSWDLIKKYDRPGPRYTSYPTAPEWTKPSGRKQYARHLAVADGQQGPLSIYVHLPFCREMCRFCGCNVVATHDRTRADAYLDVLAKEVAMVRPAPAPAHREPAPLGGGTPTFLDEKQLDRCHAIIAQHFQFAPDAEKAVEIDPAITTKSQVTVLAKLGFNRISMGVQDFDARVQEVVGRIQARRRRRSWCSTPRRRVQGRELDLIYGLPYQTPETWKRTLDRILAIHPRSPGGLRVRLRALAKPHQRLLPQEALPKTEQRWSCSWRRWTASPGQATASSASTTSRSNRTRWPEPRTAATSPELPGLHRSPGLRHGGLRDDLHLGHRRRLRPERPQAQGLERQGGGPGILPVERGASVTPDDVMRRFVINRVMCLLRLDLAEVAAEFGPRRAGTSRPRWGPGSGSSRRTGW